MSCAVLANCGWYRGRKAFRPDLWDEWLFFCIFTWKQEGDNRMKEQLEKIKLEALAAMDAAVVALIVY